MTAIRRASREPMLYDNWITTGRRRARDYKNLYPNWPTQWDGMWLTSTLLRIGDHGDGADDVATNLTGNDSPRRRGASRAASQPNNAP